MAQLPRAERECLYSPQGYDDLNLSVPDKRAIRFFRELIKSLRPDVVHFHHYRGIGIESVRAARLAARQRASPSQKRRTPSELGARTIVDEFFAELQQAPVAPGRR